MEPVSNHDINIVARQLGRRPRGRFDVAARCCHSYPQVIRVHPLMEGKPFPTLYWLTCPFLSRRIDRLESQGRVKELERRVSCDRTLKDELSSAHQRYTMQRQALLSQDEASQLSRPAMLHVLKHTGIGGIAGQAGLKCLHLHVAHELADANPVGRIVLAQYARICCPTPLRCAVD